MDSHSNGSLPPPSPSGSEPPPPPYDTLSLDHLPLHLPPPAHPPPLAQGPGSTPPVQSPLRQSQHWAVENGDGEDATNFDVNSLPPPPYSPGLRNGLGVTSNLQQNLEADREAPPSYYSLFGQIQEARHQNTSNATFLRGVCQILLGSVGWTFVLMGMMFLPLTVLVIGVVYLGKCPRQPSIPLFLVVGGLAGGIKIVLLIIKSVVRRKKSSLLPRVQHPRLLVRAWRVGNLIFNLLLFAWLVAGSYWVYDVYKDLVTTGFVTCDKVVYKFAFSCITCGYVIFVTMFSWTFFMAGTSLSRRKARRHGGTTDSRDERRRRNVAIAEGIRVREEAREETGGVESAAEHVEGVSGSVPSSGEDAGRESGGRGEGEGEGDGRDLHTSAAPVTVEIAVEVEVENDLQAASSGNLYDPSHQHHSSSNTRLAAHQSDLHDPSHQHQHWQHHRSSNTRLAAHHSDLHLPQTHPPHHHQYHTPRTTHSLLRLRDRESYPTSHPSYSLRHTSFGSNDSGLLQSRHSTHAHLQPRAASFSQFLPAHTQKATSNHSQSSIQSLCEAWNLNPRSYSLQLRSGGPREGESGPREGESESNRSSLYNTIRSDGFSITAV